MGNSCVGPNLTKNGFLQSVTAAAAGRWRGRTDEEMLPAPHNEEAAATAAAADEAPAPAPAPAGNPATTNAATVASAPPSEVRIPVAKPPEPVPPPVKMPEPAVETRAEEPKPTVEKPAEPKPTEPSKPKKPHHVKRVSSAGLQIDSVLQRKTGNLKEIYSLGRKLGQGQFGTTYLCIEKATGKEFACKSIAKRKLTTEEDVEDVRREIQIMHHLAGHPNVIDIKDAYEDAVAVHVVMELCAGGELFDRIIQRGHYTERKAADLARVIVGVVEACHSLGVMHRDLKPENFLFVNQMEESPLKTIDFGLSIFFRPGEIFNDVVGSPYYVAPEVLRKHYGQEADVWSAGVIIYILLSGVPPFWAGHPWVKKDGAAPDRPLDSAVLSRLKQFSAMNKLKKMALKVIAESLSEEEIAGLKEMFKMIDTDNSGQITFEELKAGLERVGANLKEHEIYALMEAADIDNSGTIDYGEFVAATLHLNKIEKEDHLFAAFSYFDKDCSGYITKDELQQACTDFGIGDLHLEEVIQEVDKDNDGRIDYNEFVEMMKQGNVGFGTKGRQNSTAFGFREALKLG